MRHFRPTYVQTSPDPPRFTDGHRRDSWGQGKPLPDLPWLQGKGSVGLRPLPLSRLSERCPPTAESLRTFADSSYPSISSPLLPELLSFIYTTPFSPCRFGSSLLSRARLLEGALSRLKSETQMPLWRGALRLRSPASCSCALSRGPSSSAPFHSTPVATAKWRAKFDYDKSERKSQQPSKNYAKYIVRQKRSDAKRVLNEFLLKGGYKRNFQAEWESWYVGTSRGSDGDDQPYHPGSGRPKTQKQSTRKAKQNGRKRKNWNFVTDDEQYTETIFEASFGDKRYTWSFRSQNEGDSQSSTTGFKWRDDSTWAKDSEGTYGTRKQTSYWTNNRRGWECDSDIDDDDDVGVGSSSVGSCSHRIVLGLPSTGPLKLHDVKTAFRASALKWHPDKHQGSSQATAVEKFRLCVEAYNSLCSALSAT